MKRSRCAWWALVAAAATTVLAFGCEARRVYLESSALDAAVPDAGPPVDAANDGWGLELDSGSNADGSDPQ